MEKAKCPSDHGGTGLECASDEGDHGLSESSPKRQSLLMAMLDTMDRANLSLAAGGVAFFTVFAMFPATSALISVWGSWQDPYVIQEQLEYFREIVPPAAFEIIRSQVTSLVETNSGTLGWATLISFAVALWSAMAAIDAMVRGLNAIYRKPNPHSLIAYLVSILLTLTFTATALVALTVAVVLPILLTFFHIPLLENIAFNLAHVLASTGIVLGGIWLLYRIGPNWRGSKPGNLLPGTLLAVVLWAIASLGFTYFLTNFGRYNEIYRSIAAVMILLMWLYLSAYSVLLGAALNAEVRRRRLSSARKRAAQLDLETRGADAQ